MTSGIYMIRNTVTGKRYIGSSRNIETRWEAHRNQLNGSWTLRHPNGALRDDWAQYGEAAFEFVVVEEIGDVDALAEREHHWIDLPYEEGVYNRVRRGLYAHMREIVRSVACPPQGVPLVPVYVTPEQYKRACELAKMFDDLRTGSRGA